MLNKICQNFSFFVLQKPIISLLIISLTWLLINTLVFGLHLQTVIFPDADNYYGSAVNLYQHFRGHCYRPFVFALITGLPLLFTDDKLLVFNFVIGLNIIFWLLSIVILFEIISNFVSIQKAFLFTLIFVFSISNLFYIFHYLTETIFTFIFLIIIYFFQKYWQTKKYHFLVFSLSILIVSVVIKPMTTYMAIIGLLFFIPIYLKNLKKKINILLYFSMVLITIQLIGMKAQFGNFTISYIDKVTIHNYLLSKADCLKNGEEYDQINNSRADFILIQDPVNQKLIAEKDLKKQLENNKINVLKAFFHNLVTNTYSNSGAVYVLENKNNFSFFNVFKSITLKYTKVYNVFFIISFFVFLFWYVKNWKQKQNIVISISSFLAFYTFFVSGISSDQGDRFHIVIYPLLLIVFSFFYTNYNLKK